MRVFIIYTLGVFTTIVTAGDIRNKEGMEEEMLLQAEAKHRSRDINLAGWFAASARQMSMQ